MDGIQRRWTTWEKSVGLCASAWYTTLNLFDAGFPARMAAGISNAVASRKNDPWCLGYFVENELPWEGWGSGLTEQYALPIGVLASTNALPAKAEFARLLQSGYSSVFRLNAAWNTSIASWNDISNHAVTLPSPLPPPVSRTWAGS